MKFAVAFAAAALTLAAAAPAFAGDARQTRVDYADLDLSTQDGQDALAHRIDRAIARVCNPNGLRPIAETARCYDEARANVIANADGQARAALAAAWEMDASAQYAARPTVRQ